MSKDDQFKWGRMPLRPISLNQKNLAQTKEILIDYESENPTYDIYLVDPEDRTVLINLSEKLRNAFPETNADNFKITINGKLNAENLKDIINRIYSQYVFPDDKNGFDYSEDFDKIFDANTKNVLLRDENNFYYLPVTVAANVYDDQGNTIQERLDALTRLGFSTAYVNVTTEEQSSFQVTVPFENYFDSGNFMEVRVGTTYIDNSRYEVIPNINNSGDYTTITLNFIDESFEIGRALNFLFIFNSLTSNNGEYHNISGGFIANNTITTAKLQKVSDSFTLEDSTSVATSKGLSNLYKEMMDAITRWSPSCIYCSDKNNTTTKGSLLIIDPPAGYVLRDAYRVNVRTTVKTNSSMKIQINGKVYLIYDGDEPIKYGIAAGRLIRLVYCAEEERFYINSLYDYKLTTNRFVYTAEDQEIIISYRGLQYENGDQIFVYRNGARLFEYIDYSINTQAETISLYVRTEDGDTFVFESYTVNRRNE